MSNSISYHPGIPSSSASAVGGSLLAQSNQCDKLEDDIEMGFEHLRALFQNIAHHKSSLDAWLRVDPDWTEASLLANNISNDARSVRYLMRQVERNIDPPD